MVKHSVRPYQVSCTFRNPVIRSNPRPLMSVDATATTLPASKCGALKQNTYGGNPLVVFNPKEALHFLRRIPGPIFDPHCGTSIRFSDLVLDRLDPQTRLHAECTASHVCNQIPMFVMQCITRSTFDGSISSNFWVLSENIEFWERLATRHMQILALCASRARKVPPSYRACLLPSPHVQVLDHKATEYQVPPVDAQQVRSRGVHADANNGVSHEVQQDTDNDDASIPENPIKLLHNVENDMQDAHTDRDSSSTEPSTKGVKSNIRDKPDAHTDSERKNNPASSTTQITTKVVKSDIRDKPDARTDSERKNNPDSSTTQITTKVVKSDIQIKPQPKKTKKLTFLQQILKFQEHCKQQQLCEERYPVHVSVLKQANANRDLTVPHKRKCKPHKSLGRVRRRIKSTRDNGKRRTHDSTHKHFVADTTRLHSPPASRGVGRTPTWQPTQKNLKKEKNTHQKTDRKKKLPADAVSKASTTTCSANVNVPAVHTNAEVVVRKTTDHPQATTTTYRPNPTILTTKPRSKNKKSSCAGKKKESKRTALTVPATLLSYGYMTMQLTTRCIHVETCADLETNPKSELMKLYKRENTKDKKSHIIGIAVKKHVSLFWNLSEVTTVLESNTPVIRLIDPKQVQIRAQDWCALNPYYPNPFSEDAADRSQRYEGVIPHEAYVSVAISTVYQAGVPRAFRDQLQSVIGYFMWAYPEKKRSHKYTNVLLCELFQRDPRCRQSIDSLHAWIKLNKKTDTINAENIIFPVIQTARFLLKRLLENKKNQARAHLYVQSVLSLLSFSNSLGYYIEWMAHVSPDAYSTSIWLSIATNILNFCIQDGVIQSFRNFANLTFIKERSGSREIILKRHIFRYMAVSMSSFLSTSVGLAQNEWGKMGSQFAEQILNNMQNVFIGNFLHRSFTGSKALNPVWMGAIILSNALHIAQEIASDLTENKGRRRKTQHAYRKGFHLSAKKILSQLTKSLMLAIMPSMQRPFETNLADVNFLAECCNVHVFETALKTSSKYSKSELQQMMPICLGKVDIVLNVLLSNIRTMVFPFWKPKGHAGYERQLVRKKQVMLRVSKFLNGELSHVFNRHRLKTNASILFLGMNSLAVSKLACMMILSYGAITKSTGPLMSATPLPSGDKKDVFLQSAKVATRIIKSVDPISFYTLALFVKKCAPVTIVRDCDRRSVYEAISDCAEALMYLTTFFSSIALPESDKNALAVISILLFSHCFSTNMRFLDSNSDTTNENAPWSPKAMFKLFEGCDTTFGRGWVVDKGGPICTVELSRWVLRNKQFVRVYTPRSNIEKIVPSSAHKLRSIGRFLGWCCKFFGILRCVDCMHLPSSVVLGRRFVQQMKTHVCPLLFRITIDDAFKETSTRISRSLDEIRIDHGHINESISLMAASIIETFGMVGVPSSGQSVMI